VLRDWCTVGRRAFVLPRRDRVKGIATISVGTSRVTRRHVEVHGDIRRVVKAPSYSSCLPEDLGISEGYDTATPKGSVSHCTSYLHGQAQPLS